MAPGHGRWALQKATRRSCGCQCPSVVLVPPPNPTSTQHPTPCRLLPPMSRPVLPPRPGSPFPPPPARVHSPYHHTCTRAPKTTTNFSSCLVRPSLQEKALLATKRIAQDGVARSVLRSLGAGEHLVAARSCLAAVAWGRVHARVVAYQASNSRRQRRHAPAGDLGASSGLFVCALLGGQRRR